MKRQIQFMYVLWFVILFAGALVWLAPTFFMVSAVHAAARTTARQQELKTALHEFQPSRKEYEAACADAQATWQANCSGQKSVFFLSATIFAIAVLGLIWTDRFARSLRKGPPSLSGELPRTEMKDLPNKASDATSEPAPGACSSSHEG